MDHQTADGERGPSMGLLEQQGPRAGCSGRNVDRAAALRAAERCAGFQGSVAEDWNSLRLVRQWQDGGERNDQPVRADVNSGFRAIAQPAQHVRQHRNAGVERCRCPGRERRRDPAALRAWRAQQQRLRAGERRDALRPRDDPRLRPASQQLGGLDDDLARVVVTRRRRGVVLPPRAGALHDHRQPGRRAGRLPAVLRHRAERFPPAGRRRQSDLRPLRHRPREVRHRDQQRGDLRG